MRNERIQNLIDKKRSLKIIITKVLFQKMIDCCMVAMHPFVLKKRYFVDPHIPFKYAI